MARGLMEVINISPGQPVYIEDYRMSDLGFEWNVQNEFDYRIEYLMTNRVVMTEISSKTLWGLTGWTPANSLKITISAGVLQCAVGMADIGGRRYVRTGAGAITPTGVTTDDVDYWIRAKYDTSTDTHSFVAELASAAPQSDTDTDKRVTLATAHWLSPNWTGTPVDKRTSNTQLTPPAVISGNAGSNPVLSLHQEGSGLGLLVTGGNLQVGDAAYNQQLIVYGTNTFGITIYDNPNAYSVEMIAGAADTLKVQTIGGTAANLDLGGTITNATWNGIAIANNYVAGLDQNCLQTSSPTFVGLTLSGSITGITTLATSGAITCGGTLTADGIFPEADKSDVIGSDSLTWNDIFVVNIKDDDGTICAKTASDGKFYLNAGTGINDIDIAMTASPTDDQLLTAQGIKEYVSSVSSDADLVIGSTNATWINCVVESWYPLAAFYTTQNGTIWNENATDGDVVFSVPLPTTRGGKKLYINGVRVSLKDGDSSNYVDYTEILGLSDTSYTAIDHHPDSLYPAGLYTDTSMNVDCSSYHIIRVSLACQNTAHNLLNIQFVTVRYYYA